MRSCPISFALMIAFAQGIHAQPQIGSYSPPVVNPHPITSPYLNLNRTGTNAAVNYYGIVRPQIQSHQAIQNLQNQVQTTQTQVQNQAGALSNEEMAPTGRMTGGYLNYSHYFPIFSRGAGNSGTMRR